jgi:GT2 family glycosyltransferase
MTPDADILVANRNTYPWLRLQAEQITRLKPRASFRYQIWDNNSTDGSKEWLASSGIEHHPKKYHVCHSNALEALVDLSSAPVIVFMDSDAVPIKEGWLDDALETLKEPKVGAVGLQFGPNTGKGPWSIPTIHPSFLVIRRDIFKNVGLSIREERVDGEYIDVAIPMGRRLNAAGLKLVFVGSPSLASMTPGQKVMHGYGASRVLDTTYLKGDNKGSEGHTQRKAKEHLVSLERFGLKDLFLQYVRETLPRNPLCNRYLD